MNYLAHMYLSGDDEGLIIGNFIADAVKGKRMERYPEKIRKGIKLHRAIDDFTDQHEVTAALRKKLHNHFHKYSGVVVDMYYDHFLAKNWSYYSSTKLREFTDSNYKLLSLNFLILPGRSRRILPFMIRGDWLSSYASFEGLEQAFTGMARRTPYVSNMEKAVEVLEENYEDFKRCFESFFPDLIAFVEEYKS